MTSVSASGPVQVKAEGKYVIGSNSGGAVPNGTYQCWVDAGYIRVKIGMKNVLSITNNTPVVVCLLGGFKLTLA